MTQPPSWLLAFAGGAFVWLTGIIVLSIVLVLFFVVGRRRRRRPTGPPPTSSVPFLKTADSGLYFRLDKLDGDGSIIGRGRSGIDFRIEGSVPFSDTVSNRHARIYFDATYGEVIIEDLDSTNGIFINGRQAPRKNLLKDGWVVSLGNVTFKYHDGESDTGPLD